MTKWESSDSKALSDYGPLGLTLFSLGNIALPSLTVSSREFHLSFILTLVN